MIETWLANISKPDQLLLQNMSEEDRNDSFYTSLSFGTGGIRGKVGLGPNRMSVYLVKKIMRGYGQFLQSKGKTKVAIFHDNRQMGDAFQQEAVNVLATFGITTYAHAELRPTPLLSFTIRQMGLDAGINFTASHNPKEYQGIKLYDETGCQYIPSQLEAVLPLIEEASYFGDVPTASYAPIPASVEEDFISMVHGLSIKQGASIKTVYTPLHGAGSTLIKQVIPDVIPVEQQMVVDPYFTTVDYPNPEFETAYEYAYKTAKLVGAELILASDPDADRIGCSVLHQGNYRFLTGNEIAVLILDYIVSNKTFENGIIFKSIVTSQLGDAIAKKYGIEVQNTLTGFKWMGYEMNQTTKHVVMAYEESNGVILHDSVRDKDAFQGMFILHEAASVYKARGKTLVDRLDELATEFGHYQNETLNFVLEGESGMQLIAHLMTQFRHESLPGLDSRYDYLNDPVNNDNVLELTFGPSRVMVRPSGTEPKLKMYIETVSNESSHQQIITNLHRWVEEMSQTWTTKSAA